MIRGLFTLIFASLGHSVGTAAVISSLAIPSGGIVPVSYNNWEASAIASDLEATSQDLQLNAITLRIETVVPNANLFVGVTTSQFFRPKMSEIVASMNVEPLTLNPTLNTVSEVRLLPVDNEPLPILTAGRDYWLVVGITAPDFEQEPHSSGLYRWGYAATDSTANTIVGWSIPSKIATAGTAGVNWSPSNDTPYSFEFEVTPVPEFAHFAGVTGLMALGLALRRRRA